MPPQGLQLFLPDAKLASYSTILAGHPFLASTPAQLALDSPVCENPLSFPTAAPISRPNMALVAESKRVAAQFDYTDEDVNKGVKEFLRQMGNYHPARIPQRYEQSLTLRFS